MNATVVVLLITGHGARELSLHTRREQAERALLEVGFALWVARFSYRPEAWARGDASSLREALEAEGWTVTLGEQVVEL